jgi:hypothetical protein
MEESKPDTTDKQKREDASSDATSKETVASLEENEDTTESGSTQTDHDVISPDEGAGRAVREGDDAGPI